MGKRVILCVDDEKMILDSLKTQLKSHYGNSYVYETADNPLDAMELIDELNGDGYDILLIVSDWLMPGIRGDEFLIKVHQQYPNIVKVMLTGQADNIAIEHARKEANLHRCIYKPWREEELYDTIESGINDI